MANFAYDSTDRLREMRTKGREGVQKAGKSSYVLNGCTLIYLIRFDLGKYEITQLLNLKVNV